MNFTKDRWCGVTKHSIHDVRQRPTNAKSAQQDIKSEIDVTNLGVYIIVVPQIWKENPGCKPCLLSPLHRNS